MINRPPSNVEFNDQTWVRWFSKAYILLLSIEQSGVTGDRPTSDLWVGRQYFDTTLGFPVWYDGTNWVDATGATV